MTCKYCNGTGRITWTGMVFHDGGWFPEYFAWACDCNPEPSDDDAPDWEPYGTTYDDFHPTTYLYGTE